MQVKVTRGDKWRRFLDVELTPAELAPHFEKALRRYQKRVSLQGFRKGKVPLRMVRKLYGETIQGEVAEAMLPDILREAHEKERLKIAAPAKIEAFEFAPEKGLRVRAIVDVEPEVELKKHKGFAIEKAVYEIGDVDVEAALQRLQDQYAKLQEVDGAARLGDFVEADVQEVDVAGLPVIGRKYDDRVFQIAKRDGSGNDDFDLASQLVGVKKSETRTIKLLARDKDGRPHPSSTCFQVKVKGVKEKIVPALGDAFARQAGNFDNLEQLRATVRQRLQQDALLQSLTEIKSQLIDALVKENPVELPESMVEHYLALLVEDLKKQRNEDVDAVEVRDNYRAGVIWNIKWRLLRERLIAQEKIALAPGEIEQFVRLSAEVRGQDPGRKWNRLKNNKDELDRVQQELLEDKLLDHLLSQQKISERKVGRQEVQKSKLIVEPA